MRTIDTDDRKKIELYIENIAAPAKEISDYLYANPEIGLQEFKAAAKWTDFYRRHGFQVEENVCDIATAFIACFSSDKGGASKPVIAFLAEYDALPGIGHGCGHNIYGANSAVAAVALKEWLQERQINAEVRVYGTPAEETCGSKVDMADAGLFDSADIVLAAHPGDEHRESGSSQAMHAIQFSFAGRTAHAAGSPEKGINALDAVIQTFNGINALRQHLLPEVRIHGIISEGGQAANIVPDKAVARFYVRASSQKYLDEVTEKVTMCARAGALATGATLTVSNYEFSYTNQITNQNLQQLYNSHLRSLGVEQIIPAKPTPAGSTDVGNVSKKAPTIQPGFAISAEKLTGHSREFAAATLTDYACDNMKKCAAALVLTAAECLTDSAVLDTIKKEFQSINDK